VLWHDPAHGVPLRVGKPELDAAGSTSPRFSRHRRTRARSSSPGSSPWSGSANSDAHDKSAFQNQPGVRLTKAAAAHSTKAASASNPTDAAKAAGRKTTKATERKR
jgi:hypothetical protein